MAAYRLPRALRSKGSFARVALPLFGLYILWQMLGRWSDAQYSSPIPTYEYENTTLPPLYPALRDRERKLPQHSASLPFPEGKGGTFAFRQSVVRSCKTRYGIDFLCSFIFILQVDTYDLGINYGGTYVAKIT